MVSSLFGWARDGRKAQRSIAQSCAGFNHLAEWLHFLDCVVSCSDSVFSCSNTNDLQYQCLKINICVGCFQNKCPIWLFLLECKVTDLQREMQWIPMHLHCIPSPYNHVVTIFPHSRWSIGHPLYRERTFFWITLYTIYYSLNIFYLKH
jgi:hypothetical protein